jgi:hypothetical protein
MKNLIPGTQVFRTNKGIGFTSAFDSHARVGELTFAAAEPALPIETIAPDISRYSRARE